MIKFVKGDLFESKADAVCNPVNTQGVMGKGLALQFKRLFPDYYQDYRQRCAGFAPPQPGDVWVNGVLWRGRTLWILSCFTKGEWRRPSELEWVQSNIRLIPRMAETIGDIHLIAVPPLGCGLGGLRWEDVKQAMILEFQEWPQFNFEVYEP